MKTYIVDSFTDKPFKGNPAGVCMVESPLSESQMQAIALELNYSTKGGGRRDFRCS